MLAKRTLMPHRQHSFTAEDGIASCHFVSMQSAPWLQLMVRQQGRQTGATEPAIMSTKVKAPHTMLCG